MSSEGSAEPLVSVARAEDCGLDSSDGKWLTICEQHGTLSNAATKRQAKETASLDFCEYCMRLAGETFGSVSDSLIDSELIRGAHAS